MRKPNAVVTAVETLHQIFVTGLRGGGLRPGESLRIQAEGELKQAHISSAALKYLLGLIEQDRASTRRPQKKTLSTRDWFILVMIDELVALGLKRTRNVEQTDIPSACSLISQWAKEAGEPLSEVAVQKIWERAGRWT